jgi:hypothetical protein
MARFPEEALISRVRRVAGARQESPMKIVRFVGSFASAVALLTTVARAAVVAPPGYVYSPQLLANLTQSCVAVGPGGTFVAIGPGFTANAQAVVLVQESGSARLVAFGFNSVADCAYDAASDALYVSDNADAGELAGAVTGDTVFRIPSASTAVGLSAKGLELLPTNSVPSAAGLAVDGAGNVYVGDALGGGAGKVVRIAMPAATPSNFATGMDFVAGLAFDPVAGNLFVSETRASFDAQVRRFDALGAPLGVFAGPSFAFGSYDLAFADDGRLLSSGAFAGDVVAFSAGGSPSPFVSGLNFATGVSVNAFTGRVEILSSTFIPTDEDRSIHRLTPIDHLVAGRGSARSECLHEFYGVALVAPAPGRAATQAICTDGDACDADGKKNDRCVFPLGFCLDVPDVNFADCSAATIDSFSATVKPDPLDGQHAIDALRASLPLSSASCFFSDGVAVAVKQSADGKKPGTGKVTAKATTSDGVVDTDHLMLVCKPAL